MGKPTKTQIKMPDQPETVAAEVPVTEDATDAPVKEATKEAVPEQASEEVVVKVAIKIIFSTKYFHAYLAANKFRPTRRNFGQKRAKCVKLEKFTPAPGSPLLKHNT